MHFIDGYFARLPLHSHFRFSIKTLNILTMSSTTRALAVAAVVCIAASLVLAAPTNELVSYASSVIRMMRNEYSSTTIGN